MKRLLSIVIVTLLGFSIFAQDNSNTYKDTTIIKDIEIVKEYNPVIKDAGKISTMPELKDIKSEKKNSNYSVWTSPITLEPSQIQVLDYALPSNEIINTYNKRIIRLGGGNYASALGEVYTPIFQNKRNDLNLILLHKSSFGYIDLTPKSYPNLSKSLESKATTNRNKAKLSYTRNIKNKELISYVKGDYNFFKYYGYDSKMDELVNKGIYKTDNDSNNQSSLKLAANIRFRSKDYISKWKYDLQTNYRLFSNKNKLKEHTIFTDLNGEYRLESSSFGLNMNMHNIIMDRPESDELYNYSKERNLHSYTMLKLTPHYTYTNEMAKIIIGIRGSFSIGQGKKGAITPDIYADVRIAKEKIYLYAGVTGDYVVNSYYNIIEQNQYIASDTRLEDTYIPIDVYAGFRFKFFNQLDFNLRAGYKIINNAYFFVNKLSPDSLVLNQFDAVYEENAGVFEAAAKLSYDWKERLNIRLGAKFNKWSLSKYEYAWHRPNWVLDFHSTYMINKYLRVNLCYEFEAGRYAQINNKAIKLNNTHNLSLGADWNILNWLNVFVNLDNITNTEYQDWYGYTKQGFNILGGVTFWLK
jgi:hypothetical protein